MTAPRDEEATRTLEDILAEMVKVMGELQELLPAYIEERRAKVSS
jgi:hypothetical protein